MIAALFQNKYRIKSSRLKNWDYSQDGMYSITICTKNRKLHFGNIEGGRIVLSQMGKIVQQYWNEIPKHFPNVELDEIIIMPNHIHGIVVINNKNHNGNLTTITLNAKITKILWSENVQPSRPLGSQAP